jgi:hypothetical protein
MDARKIDRIESNVERGASALFAGAVGFAACMALRAWVDQSEVAACTVAAVAIAFLLSRRTLNLIANRKPRLPVPVFDLREFDSSEDGELLLTRRVGDELLLTEADGIPDELVLTDAERLGDELVLTEADRVESPASGEPLVLDDILAELGPDARVVRLFDRKAMPTPGQLKSRIDSHLGQIPPSAGASDASQALADALAELRRSLR